MVHALMADGVRAVAGSGRADNEIGVRRGPARRLAAGRARVLQPYRPADVQLTSRVR